MAKWSIALFGHNKHRYELREIGATPTQMPMGENYLGIMQYKREMIHRVASRHVEMPTGFDKNNLFVYCVAGGEKRAVPGDIIAIRPIGHKWTPTEKSQFLIVTVEGFGHAQQRALTEPVFDLTSYEEYAPVSFEVFDADFFLQAKNAVDSERALRVYETTDRHAVYEEYLQGYRQACAFPQDYLKKRRFCLALDCLEALGVDLKRMLDKELLYKPDLPFIPITLCFDKLRQRSVEASDGLRPIQPRGII